MLSRFFGRKKSAAAAAPAGGNGEGAPAATVWQVGDRIAGRYQVQEVMSGAMGRVYIARHTAWEITLAIKSPRSQVLADTEGMQAILREADAWIRLGLHPNIASCYYVLSIDGVPHIFIEYVDGGSLADWIKAGRCRDLRTALSLAVQVCHGMAYTHSQGIIHRDIKPQNILLTKGGLAKITDFGILLSVAERQAAGVATEDDQDPRLAGTGFRGTPGFAAPEQFRDASRVDERADLFSFGICLWLMLCGRKPYRANYEPAPLPAPRLADGSPPPPVLTEILQRTVAFDPSKRYRDFDELRQRLNAAHEELFHFPCPFMELAHVDLRADSCNNRAVSLLELDRQDEARRLLDKALAINDTLEEAIYNRLLLDLQAKGASERLRRRIAVAQHIAKHPDWFADLRECAADPSLPLPPYRLCIPKHTAEIYREGQLAKAARDNITSLFQAGDFESCQEALLAAWENIGFRRDQAFAKIYSRLARSGRPGQLVAIQRLATLSPAGRSPAGRSPASRSPAGRPVQALCRLAGGSVLAALTSNGRLLAVDAGASARRPTPWPDAPPRVLCLAAAGNRLLMAGEDGTVTVRILGRKTSARHIIRTGKRVTSLAARNDGLAAAGCEDGSIFLFDGAGKRLAAFQAREGGPVSALALPPRRSVVISGSADGCLRFWDAASGECVRQTEAHALPVTGLDLAPDGLLLASYSADRRVRLWDLRTGSCNHDLPAHDEAVTGALLTADHRYLVTGGEDDLVKVWDTEFGRCRFTRDGRGDGVTAITRGRADHIVATGHQDGGITLWMLVRRLEFP